MAQETMDEALQRSFALKVYGFPIRPSLNITASKDLDVDLAGKSLELVRVTAFSVNERCTRLPAPVFLALPGDGTDADPAADPCARTGEKFLSVSLNATSLVLVPYVGNVEEILDEIVTKGISGGLKLENPRIENGKACVDVHVWAEIKVFGRRVGFDERFPICIALEGCYTVWEIGFASLEVCVRASNQICGKLCVGKWGISKCWEECIAIPISQGATTSRCKCESCQ